MDSFDVINMRHIFVKDMHELTDEMNRMLNKVKNVQIELESDVFTIF